MTAAEWATLIPALIALAGAATAWIRAEVANKRTAATAAKVDQHVATTVEKS